MISHGYREFLNAFGVDRSHCRPRGSHDNPFRESCFKTITYSPGYPGRFAEIDEARAWVAGFIGEYSNRPHEGLNFYTPVDLLHTRVEAVQATRLAGLDIHYVTRRERYPNGAPQAKRPIESVAINPGDGIIATASIIDDPAATRQQAEPIHIPTGDNLI